MWFAAILRCVDSQREINSKGLCRMRQISLFPGLERPDPVQNGGGKVTKKKPPFVYKEPIPKPSGQYEYDADFEDFWDAYPRKVAKAKAYMAYQKAVYKGHKRGLILIRAHQFAQSAIGMGVCEFIPHPATWLNKLIFTDDPAHWDTFGPQGETKTVEQKDVTWDYKG